jgi:hypothetical protein
MGTVEILVLKLNEMLDADQFDAEDFSLCFNALKELNNPALKIIDFKYYNEYRKRLAREEKIKCIKVQDFETAAKFRELEKECISYISIRTEYKIERSTFHYDQEYLFYFYLGTAKNDKKVSEYLNIL